MKNPNQTVVSSRYVLGIPFKRLEAGTELMSLGSVVLRSGMQAQAILANYDPKKIAIILPLKNGFIIFMKIMQNFWDHWFFTLPITPLSKTLNPQTFYRSNYHHTENHAAPIKIGKSCILRLNSGTPITKSHCYNNQVFIQKNNSCLDSYPFQ